MLRSVILFPEFRHMNAINCVREVYDPLYTRIPPHITLVFPFDSEISTAELQAHIAKALNGVGKFKAVLQGISGDMRDGYLFLNIKQGNDQMIALHDRLYEELLAPFLSRKMPYYPHLTVGRLQGKDIFEHAVDALSSMQDRFETVIAKVYVEQIGEDERSTIELSVELLE